jgi:O-methyltransferase involved in polyketide biosynthesis
MRSHPVTNQDSGPAFNVSVPNAARIYDFMLGGKDHFQADRDAAARLLEVLPGSAQACRANRDFLQRAVRYLSAAGIRQFIDIGSGLPTAGNTHEVAHEADQDARVAYADYDPQVLVHARALLTASPAVTVIPGDLRKPGDILAHPDLTALIDFREPLAVLLVAVVHFLTDDDSPRDAVREITAALPPGSCLALSHVTADHVAPTAAATAQGVYATASAPVTARTRAHVTRMFDGLDLIDPGVCDVSAWHPEVPPARPRGDPPPAGGYIYGGVAVKR